MKSCSKCGELKNLTDYHNQKAAADGKDPYCKQCRKITSKQYLQDNKLSKAQYNRAYYWRAKLTELDYDELLITEVITAIRKEDIHNQEIKTLIIKLKEESC